MQKKIGETSPEIWELMLNSTNTITTIPIGTERDDILFGICGLYQKGIVELYLLSIQAPNIPKEKLKPVTDEEWELAESKSKEILSQLASMEARSLHVLECIPRDAGRSHP